MTPSIQSPSAVVGDRRALLRGTLLTTAAAAGITAATDTPAAAAARKTRIKRSTKTRAARRLERHYLSRFTYGYTPAALRQMRKAGGPNKWFERQLNPASVKEAKGVAALRSWYPLLEHSVTKRRQLAEAKKQNKWDYAAALGNWTVMRRVRSNRQLHEMMVELWSDHFHIGIAEDRAWMWRTDYDRVLREHALGRFEDLLKAATLHPAMLLYLDNWRSTAYAPNENHGRELLELHTLGHGAGYTEEMVKDSATILSGWTVDVRGSWQRYYDDSRHATGRVTVLDFTSPNRDDDGRQLVQDYLRYLAHHEATARTVATKIAVRFVSDRPSKALVNRLATVYLANDTSIPAVMRALVATKEFRRARLTKARTPTNDMAATLRVLRPKIVRPQNSNHFANRLYWSHGGDRMYAWPRPDGAPDRNSAYASTSRMLGSFRFHWLAAGGWWGAPGVSWNTGRYWVPNHVSRFDELVDHLSRRIHGRPANRRLVRAAVEATGFAATTRIDKSHRLANGLMVRVLAVLLDHPAHMYR